MNAPQLAQTTLRLARKRGLSFRIERPADGEPILHVTPKAKLSAYLRQAIARTKHELIALLEAEPRHVVCVHDEAGEVVRAIVDPVCATCGGRDYAATPDGLDTVCVTCTTREEVLQDEHEAAVLAQRWQVEEPGAPARAPVEARTGE